MSATKKLTNDQMVEITRRMPETGGTQLAGEYGVSRQTIYRAKDIVEAAEVFAAKDAPAPMGEFGATGLSRFGGQIQEDYAQEWRTLNRMVPLVEEMMNHPTISSMLFSMGMFLAGAEWVVRPGGDSPEDEAAAKFLRECKDDLSHSWTDFISQALTMIPYGFAPHEICYKRRLGKDGKHPSKYDDGRLAWRKFAFRSQDTVWGWEFDDNGGIKGMVQKADYSREEVLIPITKMLLFRINPLKNNPQGKSALRACFEPWYYSKTFQEIMGISAERMGGGLPVIYLGDGTSKAGNDSDFEFAKKVVRDVRMDEQSGIVFPFQKQTADGRGVLFELVSPPSKGAIDWIGTIQMFNQQLSQTLLNQIIFLGVGEGGGAYALGVELRRIFEQSIKAYGKNIADTINRWAVSRLFSYNTFQVDELPYFELVLPENIDMLAAVNALNVASTGNLLTVDQTVERKVRELLQLPQLSEQVDAPPVDPAPEGKYKVRVDRVNAGDVFADLRTDAPTREIGRLEESTNNLSRRLQGIYESFIRRVVERLENDNNRKQRKVLGIFPRSGQEVQIVEKSLEEVRDELQDALAVAIMASVDQVYGDAEFQAEAVQLAADEITNQTDYLNNSFIPAVREKINQFLESPEGSVFKLGVLAAALGSFVGRIASYAGSKWAVLQQLIGMKLQREDKRVYWMTDALAIHCESCAEYGDREYASYDTLLRETGGVTPGNGTVCLTRCRCTLLKAE